MLNKIIAFFGFMFGAFLFGKKIAQNDKLKEDLKKSRKVKKEYENFKTKSESDIDKLL